MDFQLIVSHFAGSCTDGLKLLHVRGEILFKDFTQCGARVGHHVIVHNLWHLLPVSNRNSRITQYGHCWDVLL